jgi:hypothetical protein
MMGRPQTMMILVEAEQKTSFKLSREDPPLSCINDEAERKSSTAVFL